MKTYALKDRGVDLSALDKLNFKVSDLMKPGIPGEHGKPMELKLAEVVESPEQPRSDDNPGFALESLQELAESIAETGGLKTPISVRSKNDEGFYVINHGARRYRATRLAGLETIKAFIDDSHDEYDQAIENIQRENLTPMEIARFIGNREKVGDSRTTIAKRIGKSRAFVTTHAALLSLPGSLRQAYEEDRCRDVSMLYELSNLSKVHPEAVEAFVGQDDLSRMAVEAFKTRTKGSTPAETSSKPTADDAENSETPAVLAKAKETRLSKASLLVKHGKGLYVLQLNRPAKARHGWIEDQDTGKEQQVRLAELTIDSIVSG